MKIGDIILIPFPFADLSNTKVRPAVLIAETQDRYKDLVVCAISSIIPKNISKREVFLSPNRTNNLRVDSIIKIDRIVTLKHEDKIATLGELSEMELTEFRKRFRKMIE